jgi:hypothetical protein
VEFTECSADSLREQEEEANLIQMLCNADFYALRSDKLKIIICSRLSVRYLLVSGAVGLLVVLLRYNSAATCTLLALLQ